MSNTNKEFSWFEECFRLNNSGGLFVKDINKLVFYLKYISDGVLDLSDISNVKKWCFDFDDFKSEECRKYRTVLKKVILPYGIEEIPEYGFSYCEDLVSIELPNTIKKIGENAFKGTKFEKEMTNALIIGNTCFSINPNVTKILPKSFMNKTQESKENKEKDVIVYLDDNVKTIAPGIFDRLYNLKEVILPENVEEVYHDIFLKNTKLEKIEFNDKLKQKLKTNPKFLTSMTWYDRSNYSPIHKAPHIELIIKAVFDSTKVKKLHR